jgi:hypothetical protein
MDISFHVPEDILHQLLDDVPLPRMARMAYRQATPPALTDVEAEVTRQVQRCSGALDLPAGSRVAVAVGSRGISHLPEIVRAVVRELRRLELQPFIVPSMGSHGGATAAGQAEALAHLGITEESVGAPIVSDMTTVEVGRTADGTPVYMDRHAAAADAIVLVVRVKRHTAYHGEYESGLAKMIAIGLGKQKGASTAHARGFGEMARMVPEMARVSLERATIRLGVAVLENAHDQPFKVAVLPADRFMAEEPGLLREAGDAMPRLPFDRFDVLVIDRIGKNISGDGADPNVTGRFPTPFAAGGPEVTRQVVLDLDPASTGNANGIGTADFTTVRLARKMDLAATYPNSLTSTVPGPVKLPMVLPNDRLAFQAALLTCNAVGRAPRLVRIRDTLRLSEIWISASLLEEAQQNPSLECLDGPAPLSFDSAGNLPDLADL